MLKTRIAKTTPQPGILAMSTHTGSTGEESESFKPSNYRSARGEDVRYLIGPFISYNDRQIQQLIKYRLNIDHLG